MKTVCCAPHSLLSIASDMAVVLLPNKKPISCIYVWMGEEFIIDEGYNKSSELAEEFLELQGLPSTTVVKTEKEGKETDNFWDFFVNG